MKTSIKIGSVLGIPIKIHFTFLFILALFTWVLSIETVSLIGFNIGFGNLPIHDAYKIILGAAASILLFICVLFHELAHSYLTQKFGHKVNRITLFIFGGSSESEEIPKDPKKEVRIALVGPLVSLLIGACFFTVYILLRPYQTILVASVLFNLFGTLSFYNIILAGFNLIPAFPIDGGRVLRSLLAMKMNYQKATKTATCIGKGAAIALGVFGVFFNLWLLLIAVFIFFGAYQEQKTSEISNVLEGKKINELMRTDIHTVTPDTPLQNVYEQMKKHKKLVYPVVEDDEFRGVINIEDLKTVEKSNWFDTKVTAVMRTDIPTVQPGDDAFSVFKTLMKKNLDRIFVKDDEKLIGFISRNDFLRTIKFYDVNKGSV